jgi:hypothetical protein
MRERNEYRNSYCMSERILIICFSSVVGRVHFNPFNVYGSVDRNTATVDMSEIRVVLRRDLCGKWCDYCLLLNQNSGKFFKCQILHRVCTSRIAASAISQLEIIAHKACTPLDHKLASFDSKQ